MRPKVDPLPRDFGDYELIARLGTGSGGALRAPPPRRPRAPRRDQDPPPRCEGRIGTLLRHPNLVRVIDVGEVQGRPFVALELVDGCSAFQLRKEVGGLGPRAWLQVARQAALGLAALHDAGVVGDIGTPLLHLDLKPGNLLVDRAGGVKLADYGLSQLTSPGATQFVEGTPGYMPAEQLEDGAVDGRSDLFAATLQPADPHGLLPSRPRPRAARPGPPRRAPDDPATWTAFQGGLAGAIPSSSLPAGDRGRATPTPTPCGRPIAGAARSRTLAPSWCSGPRRLPVAERPRPVDPRRAGPGRRVGPGAPEARRLSWWSARASARAPSWPRAARRGLGARRCGRDAGRQRRRALRLWRGRPSLSAYSSSMARCRRRPRRRSI